VVNNTLFRILIGGKLKYLRNLLLRAFGAHLPLHVMVYPSAKVFAPWNLVMGRYSCIGPKVEIYNKATVELGDNCVISQGAKLYTASHDITSPTHDLIIAPITIEKQSWIAADAFIGMGVTIGEGAVVGARAAVFKDVEPWTVVGGNPAKFIKKRVIKDA
jgi:putative colanic acid biosynthesis acetyltransferase WcaF